jgi:hypothetical protein
MDTKGELHLRFSDSKLIQLVKRNIYAVTLCSIFSNVSEDVGELVGSAQSKSSTVYSF